MKNQFIYTLNGPTPPGDVGLGRWGFAASLDKEVAIQFRETVADKRYFEMLREEGSDIIEKYGLNEMGAVVPYVFFEGSHLLRGINVPGDACDLSIDDYYRELFIKGDLTEEKDMNRIYREKEKMIRPIDYTPHNIDTKEQAFCLSSLFTNWANITNMRLNM